MKKILGIVLIIIGFCLAVIIKIGPSQETSWLFRYGELPPLLIAAAMTIPGMIIYNKNK